MLERPNRITNQLHEIEPLNVEVERREPMFVGFFIPQYDKQKILELFKILSKNFVTLTSMKKLK